MNVVPVEKLQMDLSIGIEMNDRIILRSVAKAASVGVWQCKLNETSNHLGDYLLIEKKAESVLNRLLFQAI